MPTPREDSTQRVDAPARAIAVASRESLGIVREDLGDCTRCNLSASRKQIVFGVGNPNARLMFVGEAPGADDDAQGEPFVGAAGQLLTKIIEAIGLSREDVYIANIVKCRPLNDRPPAPAEIDECRPFLDRQIASVRPGVLVGLGNVAVKALLGIDTGILKMRGEWREYCGIPFMPTVHPNDVLTNAAGERAMMWGDIQKVAERYNEDLPSGVKPATIKSRARTEAPS